ncbi:molecular chaperone DnaJ [Pseudofrankia asymbiotica]|uniref:Molecular chaperone DnaJ n=1 Tax=Pseudofrankia asymbiotica TaxID=1834516 RepID=A0A1V2I1F7_9ACTN|nr:molecular chaperone DnaJ [Pseudofrankia asymbiotica]ONH23201.1 molecular chaperone DnaJ [Pseudofrankia asymbiotica]
MTHTGSTTFPTTGAARGDAGEDGPRQPASFDEVIDLVLRQGLGERALFGPAEPAAGRSPEAALRAARRAYRAMARLTHPDVAPAARRADAANAFARLTELWEAYQLAAGAVPGSRRRDRTGTVVFGRGRATTARPRAGAAMGAARGGPAGAADGTGDRFTYTVGERYADGDIATLYRVARTAPADGGPGGPADGDDPPYVVKIARSAADDDLVAREAAALRRIARLGDPKFAPYVPRLVDTGRFADAAAGGAGRRANVLGRLDGFVTLAQVRAAYPGGVDPRDAVWMWRRLLVAVGHAHRAGVAHGAVLPGHVLIHPEQHGLVLVDWCYSAVPDPAEGAVVGPHRGAGPAGFAGGRGARRPGRGDEDPSRRIPALVEAYADWYPPEVARREPPGAATDLALATRCVSYLLGSPDPARLGAGVPAPIRRFLGGCLLPAPSMRPDDAWQLLGELDDLLGRLYGPRRFRPFTMPRPTR